jgi:hypothetical protein
MTPAALRERTRERESVGVPRRSGAAHEEIALAGELRVHEQEREPAADGDVAGVERPHAAGAAREREGTVAGAPSARARATARASEERGEDMGEA